MEEDWARIEAELNHTNEIRETKYLFMIFFAGKGTRIIRALQYLKIMKKLTNKNIKKYTHFSVLYEEYYRFIFATVLKLILLHILRYTKLTTLLLQ